MTWEYLLLSTLRPVSLASCVPIFVTRFWFACQDLYVDCVVKVSNIWSNGWWFRFAEPPRHFQALRLKKSINFINLNQRKKYPIFRLLCVNTACIFPIVKCPLFNQSSLETSSTHPTYFYFVSFNFCLKVVFYSLLFRWPVNSIHFVRWTTVKQKRICSQKTRFCMYLGVAPCM